MVQWFLLRGLKPLLVLMLVFPVVSVLAQEESATGITIHVVQRDETLSQIAVQYGTTLDALITANSILDPNRLQVGQRLIIPGANALRTPGMLTTHIVEPGETLYTIAAQYNSTPQSLSELNKIPQSRALYVGQNIQVSVGATGVLPPDQVSLHIVKPGETLLSVAIHYQLPLLRLVEANGLTLTAPLQSGQGLIIPGSELAGRFATFPAIIQRFALGPLPATQGQTLSAALMLPEGSSVTGKILDRTVTFTQDGNFYYAMIGLHAFTEPGIYPLELQITDATGAVTTYTPRVYIQDGGYGQEQINVAEDRQNLLAPEIVQSELTRITEIMSGYTPQRNFDGLMSLPSTGPVTSRYGTRRSYNGSAYDTFHGGADFGGATGTPIRAAASGVVVLAEALQVRGNAVIIDHGWGVYTGYWHQTQFLVAPGQFVQRGDIIGYLGGTGLVTGPHLHWEMWVGGVQVDPLQWLSQAVFQAQSAG